MGNLNGTPADDAKIHIAKGIAATSLIFFVCIFIPFFGIVFSVLIPLPVLHCRSKLGRRPAAWVIGGTTVLIALLTGGATFDVFYFGQLMLLGFALGEMFQRRLPVEKTVFYACAVYWAFAAAVVLFASAAADTDILSLVEGFIDKNLAISVAYFEKMGADPDQMAALKQSLDKVRFMMIRIIPGTVAAATLFAAWFNLLAARRFFAATNVAYPDFGPLRTWSAPEHLVWAAVASGTMLLIPWQSLFLLGLNVCLVLVAVYFFQGIAIVSFFFEKHDFPPLLRVIVYAFVTMQLMMACLVAGIGFFDTWFNFRKLERRVEKQ